jgi:hypothetical protein
MGQLFTVPTSMQPSAQGEGPVAFLPSLHTLGVTVSKEL